MAYILASMSLTSSYYYLLASRNYSRSIRNSVCSALLLCILRAYHTSLWVVISLVLLIYESGTLCICHTKVRAVIFTLVVVCIP